jgi:hypothetical protein
LHTRIAVVPYRTLTISVVLDVVQEMAGLPAFEPRTARASTAHDVVSRRVNGYSHDVVSSDPPLEGNMRIAVDPPLEGNSLAPLIKAIADAAIADAAIADGAGDRFDLTNTIVAEIIRTNFSVAFSQVHHTLYALSNPHSKKTIPFTHPMLTYIPIPFTHPMLTYIPMHTHYIRSSSSLSFSQYARARCTDDNFENAKSAAVRTPTHYTHTHTLSHEHTQDAHTHTLSLS